MDEPEQRSTSLPADIPPEVVPFLQQAGYLDVDRLSVGDPAPDPPLWTTEGAPFRLSRFRGERPVVLIFGSYT
jgi:hypothetical protein